MLTVLRWLARCPLWLLHVAGGLLGWAAYLLSPSYRRRLRENAALASITVEQRRRSVAEAGKMVTEGLRLWLRAPDRPLEDPVHWEGEAVIEQALALGRGLIFLTPHLGSFELTAQAYAQRFGARHPITVLYRPARHPVLRELQQGAREREALATAPASLRGVRQMLRALKQGQAVGLLPDQVPPLGLGVWADFYGRPAYTMTLAARLAQQTGAPIVLALCERLPRGAGYRLRLSRLPERLPEPGPGLDGEALLVAQAAAINHAMMGLIAQCPQQYLWGYNRYKAPRAVEAFEA